MTELRIPLALNPKGVAVHISVAKHLQRYYTCPVCHGFVFAKQGEQRRWHFAHYHEGGGEADCALKSQPELERLMRRTPIEARESHRELNTRLVIHPREPVADLVAWIRLPRFDEFVSKEQIGEMLKTIRVNGNGVESLPSPLEFHPARGEVVFKLNPESTDYKLEIHSTVKLRSIEGSWTVSGLNPGDMFIGDWNRADRFDTFSGAEDGDVVYIISADGRGADPREVRRFSLGKRTLLGVELAAATRPWLQAQLKDVDLESHDFSVDVVLPATANPRGLPRPEGLPSQECMLAITPQSDEDPTFEIVSVPATDRNVLEIRPTGRGKPRFYFPTFPAEGSRWLSVHHYGSHRLIQLHTSPELPASIEGSEPDLGGPPVGIRVQKSAGGELRLNPILDERSHLLPRSIMDTPKWIGAVGPPGMRVTLNGRVVTEGRTSVITETDVALAEVPSRVEDWFRLGCADVVVDFDTLGRVAFSVEQAPPPSPTPTIQPMRSKASIEDITRWLQTRPGGIPPTVTWALVRDYFDLASGSPHTVVGGGMKKLFRRALLQIRK